MGLSPRWCAPFASHHFRVRDCRLAISRNRRSVGCDIRSQSNSDGLRRWGTDGLQTLRWRRESGANSSLKPNSLLAGNLQGIYLFGPLRPAQMVKISQFDQHLRGQFPTPPNREFFGALQGIKSGDQGNFRPDQRIPGIGDSCRDGWRRPVSDQGHPHCSPATHRCRRFQEARRAEIGDIAGEELKALTAESFRESRLAKFCAGIKEPSAPRPAPSL